jgi:hypothetical protein
MDAQSQGPICQSCSMPMQKPEDFGKNADGTQNVEYCCHCFQNGAFVNPEMTVEQMVEMCSKIMRDMHLPEELVGQAANAIPTLKRWQSA